MRGGLRFVLILILVSLWATGCSAPRQPAADSTPAPLTLAAEFVGQATNYGGALLGQLEILKGVMGRYSELLDNPRLGERDWELLVNAQGAAIDLAYEGISRIDPPEPLLGLHSTAVEAADECLAARKTVQAAMLAADTSKLPEAVRQTESCIAKTSTVRGELLRIAEANNLKLSELPLSGALTLPSAVTDSNLTGVVNEAANLRAGPGTNYNKVGGLQKDTRVTVIGRNETGDWLVIQAEGVPQAWIAGFLLDGVQDVQGLPIVRPPP